MCPLDVTESQLWLYENIHPQITSKSLHHELTWKNSKAQLLLLIYEVCALYLTSVGCDSTSSTLLFLYLLFVKCMLSQRLLKSVRYY